MADELLKHEPLLILTRPGAGLFSLYFMVLSILERHPDREPVVYFGRDCLYFAAGGRRGARNAWEYYFRPTSRWSAADLLEILPEQIEELDASGLAEVARERGLQVEREPHYGGCATHIGEVREECRPVLGALARRHLRPREDLQRLSDRYAARWFAGRRVVGVHYRGTDKSHEVVRVAPELGHAAVLHTLDEYLDQVPADADRVYLATDSEEALRRARRRLGERLLYRRGVRSRDGLGVHVTPQRAAAGEDAVLDWLLLSRCAHLVHGLSCLSGAALVWSPALPHTDMTLRFPVQDPRALVLRIEDSAVYGPQPRLIPHEEGGQTVLIWDRADAYVAWDVRVPVDGKYRVEIQYSCPFGYEGHGYSVGIEGGDRVESQVRSTSWQAWLPRCDWSLVGRLRVPAGRHQLAVRARPGGATPVMALHALRLVPA